MDIFLYLWSVLKTSYFDHLKNVTGELFTLWIYKTHNNCTKCSPVLSYKIRQNNRILFFFNSNNGIRDFSQNGLHLTGKLFTHWIYTIPYKNTTCSSALFYKSCQNKAIPLFKKILTDFFSKWLPCDWQIIYTTNLQNPEQ